MARAFGFLALIVTAVLAFAMLTGSLTGTMHTVSQSAGVNASTMSPLAMGYAALGIMMGFAMASLLRFSWIELPRLAYRWLLGQRRSFAMFTLACCLAGVVVFY